MIDPTHFLIRRHDGLDVSIHGTFGEAIARRQTYHRVNDYRIIPLVLGRHENVSVRFKRYGTCAAPGCNHGTAKHADYCGSNLCPNDP